MAYNPAATPAEASFLLSHTFWVQDMSADHALAAFGWGPIRFGLQASVEAALGVERRDINGLLLGSTAWSRQEAALSAAASLGSFDAGVQVGGQSFSAYGPGASASGSLGLAWQAHSGLRLGAVLDRQEEAWQWRAATISPMPYAPRWTLGLGVLADTLDTRWGLGLEWQAMERLDLRGAWQQLQNPPSDGSGGTWSLGVGTRLNAGQLDYAYQDLGALGGAHRLQWRSALAWGPSPTPQASPSPTTSPTPSPSPAYSATLTLTASASPTPGILSPTLTPTPSPTVPKRPVPLRFVIPD